MTEIWHVELIHVKKDRRVTRQLVHVNHDDDEALRMWLIDLAVEHAFERREQVERWIGDYALHLCLGLSSTPQHRFRSLR